MRSICVIEAVGSGSMSSKTSRANAYPLCQGDEVIHAGTSDIRSFNSSESLTLVRALKYSVNSIAAALLETFGPHSTLKCNTSGGGDRFSGRMMLRIGQEAATVPVTKQERLPCPRATAT